MSDRSPTALHTPLYGRRRAVAWLLAAPAGTAALAPAPGRAKPPPGIVGQSAPEPRAEFWIDAAGKPATFRLAEQRERWVHLKFWQSWCPGCHAHGFPALAKMAQAFADEPRVVNVALQTVFEGFGSNGAEKVRQTQLRYRLPILFGHDPGNGPRARAGGTMARYRSGGTPWHVLVDPQGMVACNGFSLDAERAIEVLRERLRKG